MPNIGPLEIMVLLVMFGLPAGLIILLVQRSNTSPCWQCGTRIKQGIPKCTACGAEYPTGPGA